MYGVSVPGADGRAGMAALVVNADFDLAGVSRRCRRSACRPMRGRCFCGCCSTLEATGTFKPRKQELMQAGFDPSRVTDPLYFDDARAQRYVPLDAALHAAILDGTIRI